MAASGLAGGFAYVKLESPDARMQRIDRRQALRATAAAAAVAAAAGRARASNRPFVHSLLAGTRWETACHVRGSGKPGPVVLVMAGVHGDEPAGVEAAELIRTWSIERGSILVIPCANRPARAVRSRYAPDTPHADLARCFPRAPGDEPRGPLAAALWQLIVRLEPAWLVDLHEGWGVHRNNAATLGSSVMHDAMTRPEAHLLVQAVNASIPDPSRHFVAIERFIAGSSVHAASQFLRVRCLVQETTRAGAAVSSRAAQHVTMTRRLLSELRMLEP